MQKLLLILFCLPIIGFGQCKGDCFNGQGTYIWSSGEKYIGGFENGKFQGKGTYTYNNGDEYSGEFKDGQYHGQGTSTWDDGDKYVGKYKDGKWHGKGTYTYASGDEYVGEYKDGKWHGKGTYTYAGGDKYVGEYKDNKYNGQGTYTFGEGEWEGDKYVGGYKDGEWHGKGTYTWANSLVWSGKYEIGVQKDGHYNTENYYNLDDILGKNLSSEINLIYSNNSYTINLNISGIQVNFLFDTGATNTQINKKLLNQLINSGAKVKILDIQANITYGSGNVVPGQYAIINNLSFGDYVLNNVVVLVGNNQSSSLLLGIGTLNKFKSWSVSKNGLLQLVK